MKSTNTPHLDHLHLLQSRINKHEIVEQINKYNRPYHLQPVMSAEYEEAFAYQKEHIEAIIHELSIKTSEYNNKQEHKNNEE